MAGSGQSKGDGSGDHRDSKREVAQATLSAIGDVLVAAAEAARGVANPWLRTRWVPLTAFLTLAFLISSGAAIYARKSAPWVQVFVAPLPLVLMATLAFWRRQVWKLRTRAARFKARTRQDTIAFLAHETANGLNAIRANLTGFLEAESLPAAAGHFRQVQ